MVKKEKNLFEKLAAKVILCGFEGLTLFDELIQDLKEGCVGGIILFKRNVKSIDQVHSLLLQIKKTAPKSEQPVLGIDHEGGRVMRIKEPLTPLECAEKFSLVDDAEFTCQTGFLVGKELRALGFTQNFAPVLDINTNVESKIIGDRAFGNNPQMVIKHGLAFARGLLKGGVFPCAKHFPGHGDTALDSHFSLPVIKHDLNRLLNMELKPFAAFAQEQLGSIMTAHISYPNIDPENLATNSKKIIGDLLREKLNFQGAVLSDDLEMKAINNQAEAQELAVSIIKAGVDGLLVCSNWELREEIISRLAKEASTNESFCNSLKIAASRISPLAYPKGHDIPFSYIQSKEHQLEKNNYLSRLKGSEI